VKTAVLVIAAILFAFGLVMIFSTTSAEFLDHDISNKTDVVIMKQILYGVVGAAIGWCAYRLGPNKWISWSPYLLALLTLLLILVLIPGVGREVNGARRWLGFAGFSIQPSEFVKYVAPAYFLYFLRTSPPGAMTFLTFLKLVGILAVPLALVAVEPNNGTAAVIGLLFAVMCFVTSIKFRYWVLPLIAAIAIGGTFALNHPYVVSRIKVYLHPELDLKGKGHQPHQAKIAAGSGGLLGRGPGNSLQKLSYLPEAQNDYIAAIFAEEYGFVGILILIFLYMLLSALGFSIAMQAANPEAVYYGAMVSFLIGFQAFINLGVVSGLLPSTGLNLPLLSQGGSSMMATLMGIGLLYSIGEKRMVKA
jgi:cell division protein FtsW